MEAAHVKNFIERWNGRGREKSDTQKFWLELIHYVLGLDNPGNYIEFEKNTALEHISYIDAYIPSTRTVIEQKSFDVNLDKPVLQSDGQSLTPFQQAKRYSDWLPDSERARWIIICNFQQFVIHDMEHPKAPPAVINLSELEHERHKLLFMIDVKKTAPDDNIKVELSIKAGELVKKLYDSLLERYINPKDKDSLRSLNIFCVRIVFLLYAEDSGLFAKSQFHDYLKSRENTARDSLKKLFAVLNQEIHERDPYLEADLKAFPYVNGGLFESDNIELPQLDGEPLRIIIKDMSEGFDWSGISPTIFGAVFESTLNPQTRKSGGMHYTSIENIHKVIDPLFLDDLNRELDTCSTPAKLRKLQKKLASIKFFDPACGSGNFLTESYLSLRRLENKILSLLSHQISFSESESDSPIQVSISQFYGIEINDFAVNVARTALWIAESQMWIETRKIIHFYGERLPLKEYEQIKEGNALTLDWQTVITPQDNLYIVSNPPFLGYSIQNKTQKQEITNLFTDSKTSGKIDYVAGWYYKACEFMKGSRVKAAFVSTNSITQGEQVSYVFKTLSQKFGIEIDFAHQTFIWNSEAKDKAHVHCVVIGFSVGHSTNSKRLFTPEGVILADNINFYLVPGPNVFAEPRTKPVSKDAPAMMTGNMPADGGNLIIDSKAELDDLLEREPKAAKYIKRYMMGYEFINNVPRWCLWLVGASPGELRSMPLIAERVKAVKEFRVESKREATQKLAESSWLFAEIRQPDKNYIAIPKTSSENRSYIPIGWLDDSIIAGDGLRVITDATLYHFGVLTSRVHMSWLRSVCGRLKSDYRYSQRVVYNNFIWPSPTQTQCSKIESTAQMILDARALYPDSSFADLYDDDFMPVELRKAHRENDSAVCEAYGWPGDISEGDITAGLFELYGELAR